MRSDNCHTRVCNFVTVVTAGAVFSQISGEWRIFRSIQWPLRTLRRSFLGWGIKAGEEGQSGLPDRPRPQRSLKTALGHERKSAEATGMSVPGGRADLNFGRLDVCL